MPLSVLGLVFSLDSVTLNSGSHLMNFNRLSFPMMKKIFGLLVGMSVMSMYGMEQGDRRYVIEKISLPGLQISSVVSSKTVVFGAKAFQLAGGGLFSDFTIGDLASIINSSPSAFGPLKVVGYFSYPTLQAALSTIERHVGKEQASRISQLLSAEVTVLQFNDSEGSVCYGAFWAFCYVFLCENRRGVMVTGNAFS